MFENVLKDFSPCIHINSTNFYNTRPEDDIIHDQDLDDEEADLFGDTARAAPRTIKVNKNKVDLDNVFPDDED